jgi:hypothetical protein
MATPAQVAAAIRRASQQARMAMQQLDAAAVEELVRIYTEAIGQVQAEIEAAATDGAAVRLPQLRELMARIEAVLEALGRARDAVVAGAIVRAAELGVRPLTAEGLAATGREVEAVLDGLQAAELVDQAVLFVREFRADDGLVLSDRLWRVDRGARELLGRTIEQAVVQGWSADRAAQEAVVRGRPVPEGTEQAQSAARVGNLVQAADVLRDERTGPLAATLRVMRTEINRAHGEAYMAGAEQAPGFVGFRFLLSPMHPRPDICDLLARQNLHGLGPGVYPTRQKTPWPAHPNTLSFLVAVFEPEVTDADRAGQETTLQALQRLAPEIRKGVLGPTKAAYFDQGLLSGGMVRSRVGAVRQRLERQGRLP